MGETERSRATVESRRSSANPRRRDLPASLQARREVLGRRDRPQNMPA